MESVRIPEEGQTRSEYHGRHWHCTHLQAGISYLTLHPFHALKAVLLMCQACETQDMGMHMRFGTGMG